MKRCMFPALKEALDYHGFYKLQVCDVYYNLYWKSYAQSLLDNVGFGGKKALYSEYYFPNLTFVFGGVLDGVEFI